MIFLTHWQPIHKLNLIAQPWFSLDNIIERTQHGKLQLDRNVEVDLSITSIRRNSPHNDACRPEAISLRFFDNKMTKPSSSCQPN